VTNTALTNTLDAEATYSLSSRLLMLGSGQVPKLTYTNTTYIKLPPKAGTELDTTNKTNVDGLGHVTHREEVASQDNETGTCLEVTVSHNNWDAVVSVLHVSIVTLTDASIQDCRHRFFQAKYIIPGSKNLIKTHSLYQVGREIQAVGVLIDFDLKALMPVVLMRFICSV
jgi:hypothetical protein